MRTVLTRGLLLAFFLLAAGLLWRMTAGTAAPKLSPAGTVKAGWDNFRLSEFGKAERYFRSILESASDKDDLYWQALFGLGHTLGQRQPDADRPGAEAAFLRLAKDHPEHPLAGWSLLAVARLKELVAIGETPDADAVQNAYQTVIDRCPNHPAADEALAQLLTFRLARANTPGEIKAVRDRADQFLKDRPDSKMRAVACTLSAICARELGDGPGNVAVRIEGLRAAARESDPNAPRVDNASDYWILAVTAEFDAGDFATARTYYRRLIQEYPKDLRKFPAGLALKRMDETEARLRREMAATPEGAAR